MNILVKFFEVFPTFELIMILIVGAVGTGIIGTKKVKTLQFPINRTVLPPLKDIPGLEELTTALSSSSLATVLFAIGAYGFIGIGVRIYVSIIGLTDVPGFLPMIGYVGGSIIWIVVTISAIYMRVKLKKLLTPR